MSSLRNPEALCERLGQVPSLHQRTVMHDFSEGRLIVDVQEIPSKQTTNAVAVCALWRLMLMPGSKCFVIAANRDLEKRFMSYLYQITTMIDPALTSLTKWSGVSGFKVGGSELKMLPNKYGHIMGLHDPVVTWVVLGAGSSEEHFSRAREAVEGAACGPQDRIINVW